MKNSKLRIVFAGTPDFAREALAALLNAGHDICAVYCQPDRPSGRGKKLVDGPVKSLALEHQIPVEQPQNFKDPETVDRLASYQSDLMIVAAYGLLLPESVLTLPAFGCINIHGSLLPRWRGAAPIHRAIESGDEQTGITIMQMDKGLDTGNMLLKKACPILLSDTGSSLHDKLAILGGQAINEFLDQLEPSAYDPASAGEPQDEAQACYAQKLNKAEANIDWTLPAQQIERKIRAFNAWPVCFTYVNGKRLRLWQSELLDEQAAEQPGTVFRIGKQGIDVVAGDGRLLRLTSIQPDGAKAMDAAALLNSKRAWFEGKPQLGANE